jgi:hypothetical protein
MDGTQKPLCCLWNGLNMAYGNKVETTAGLVTSLLNLAAAILKLNIVPDKKILIAIVCLAPALLIAFAFVCQILKSNILLLKWC